MTKVTNKKLVSAIQKDTVVFIFYLKLPDLDQLIR